MIRDFKSSSSLSLEFSLLIGRAEAAPRLQRRSRLCRNGVVAHPGRNAGLPNLQHPQLGRQAGRFARYHRISYRRGLFVGVRDDARRNQARRKCRS